jgi:hypothetical protein
VNTLFMAVVGALALAAGLAFGLGGRDTAALIVRNIYERSKENAPKIQRAASEVSSEMSDEAASRPILPPSNQQAFGDD